MRRFSFPISYSRNSSSSCSSTSLFRVSTTTSSSSSSSSFLLLSSSTSSFNNNKRQFSTANFVYYQHIIPKHIRYGLLAVTTLGLFGLGWFRGKEEIGRIDKEEALHAPDYDQISHDLQKTFEFRPDLAPTMIRFAFVLCALRQHDSIVEIAAAKEKSHHNDSSSLSLGFSSDISSSNTSTNNLDEAWRICSSFTGVDEVIEVLGFHQLTHAVSMQDLAVIGAMTAIKFLRGPYEKLHFRWGRKDEKLETVILKEEEAKLVARLAERKQKARDAPKQIVAPQGASPQDARPTATGSQRKFFGAYQHEREEFEQEQEQEQEKKKQQEQEHQKDNTSSTTTTTTTTSEIQKKSFLNQLILSRNGDEMKKVSENLIEAFQQVIPSLTKEEATALLALHGVGDYHSDVSGVEQRVKPSRCSYVLSSQYYRTFGKLKFAAPSEVPRSMQNKEVRTLPLMMEAPIQVIAASGNKAKRKAACPVSEFLLLRSDDSVLKEYVDRFSDKQFGDQIWRVVFMSAMQKVFDGGCGENELRELPKSDHK